MREACARRFVAGRATTAPFTKPGERAERPHGSDRIEGTSRVSSPGRSRYRDATLRRRSTAMTRCFRRRARTGVAQRIIARRSFAACRRGRAEDLLCNKSWLAAPGRQRSRGAHARASDQLLGCAAPTRSTTARDEASRRVLRTLCACGSELVRCGRRLRTASGSGVLLATAAARLSDGSACAGEVAQGLALELKHPRKLRDENEQFRALRSRAGKAHEPRFHPSANKEGELRALDGDTTAIKAADRLLGNVRAWCRSANFCARRARRSRQNPYLALSETGARTKNRALVMRLPSCFCSTSKESERRKTAPSPVPRPPRFMSSPGSIGPRSS